MKTTQRKRVEHIIVAGCILYLPPDSELHYSDKELQITSWFHDEILEGLEKEPRCIISVSEDVSPQKLIVFRCKFSHFERMGYTNGFVSEEVEDATPQNYGRLSFRIESMHQ